MSNFFLGEIMMSGFTFAPRGFALCNGQVLSIQQNSALFSLLGTFYGGNGVTTFALPNLQGRTPIGAGSGPGLTAQTQGEAGGQTTVALPLSQMAAHTHALTVSTANADRSNATGNYFAVPPDATYSQAAGPPADTVGAVPTLVGGNQPHNNRSPYLVLNFFIATTGIFPSRN